ncbi:MAG: hypothetical protein KTR31_39530 [Myxococcales bacterium]|nr:hypothetical protein [Myxococcales bacterium]
MRWWLPWTVVAGSCLPTFDQQPYLVSEERVLAVRGLPAEAMPNDDVDYEALVVGPDGPIAQPVEWAYCTEPRRAEERTGVTASCASGDDLSVIEATTTVLSDACARFGPNPPPVAAGEPARRPADPDPSGGYFLPVRARVDEAVAFGFQRIRCDLPGATREIFEAFQERYADNRHPEIEAVRVWAPDGSEVALSGAVASVEAGQTLRLEVVPAVDAVEPYVVYVPEASAVEDRTEELLTRWYVTDGVLLGDRLSLPDTAGPVHAWIVLTDSRGGSAWAGVRFDVLPRAGGATPR